VRRHMEPRVTSPVHAIAWLLEGTSDPPGHLWPRWIFLRALGAIYFSAFYSLAFQIRGLIGPDGILPAESYLKAVAGALGPWQRLASAPTLLWWSSGPRALSALCFGGMAASLLLVVNLWPRGTLALSFVCFLSFVAAAQDFSGYQSDGMLLEAGFLALFLAPGGLRPGLGRGHPPSRASLYLLRWEWFRIYFESGVVKLLSGDPEWRNFTAMDEYYQNGPLPTWIGYYVQHLPHAFHAVTVCATLALELALVFLVFLPRRFRLACFLIATPWQIAVILTANYAFLNYLVLSLGVLLLDDGQVVSLLPARFREKGEPGLAPAALGQPGERPRRRWRALRLSACALALGWVGYATAAELAWLFARVPIPSSPVTALAPFRIANRYGLFAVMTRGRYEIEFQGSADGQTWVAYPFRYKAQSLDRAPRIFAPYQPRLDWNLWFASLGSWREYSIVPNLEIRLLQDDRDVLELFAGNPFERDPPRAIRVLLWQYWFTSLPELRKTGRWWRRELLGLYAPTVERTQAGELRIVEWPTVGPRD